MSTKRILVVDDEEGVRASLAANLELEGYTVVEAKDGAEAVELFKAG
jgi:two-component system, NtrC family, response regulator HydG